MSKGLLSPNVTKLAGSTALYSGEKDVTTAGTAEALASSQTVRSVLVRAKAANTGDVYVGPSGVTSTTGLPLSAGEAITLAVNDLDVIYVDADTDGEGVNYVAEGA